MLSSFMVIIAGLAAVFAYYFSHYKRKALVRRHLEGKENGTLHRRSFHPKNVPDDVDVVVIGSGIGGCTAASVLAQRGYKVLILEQHDKLGGCTHTFELNKKNQDGVPGFTQTEFDTGTHYVGVDTGFAFARSGAIMNMVTGGNVDFSDLGDIWDSVLFPEDSTHLPDESPNLSTYEFRKGRERIVDEIVNKVDPKSKGVRERISYFLDFCHKAEQSIVPLFISRLLPRNLEWIMTPWTRAWYKYSCLTTAYVMNAIFDCNMSHAEVLTGKSLPNGMPAELSSTAHQVSEHPLRDTWRRCKGILTHPIGDYACQPRDSSVTAHSLTSFYYFNGAAYTVGPTQNLSREAARIVIERGGDAMVNAHVEQIIIEDGRAVGVSVKKAHSQKEAIEIRARVGVVNSCGVYNLYNNLLPVDNPTVMDWKATSKHVPSTGHIYLFVALRGDWDEIGIPPTNGWYIGGYDVDEKFDAYWKDKEGQRSPTCYLGFPCSKDKTWKNRHPGISNCILISDGKWDWYKEWADTEAHHRGDEYERIKSRMTEHLLNILYDKVPSLKGRVIWSDMGTPLSDNTYLGSFEGGSYGTRCNIDYFSKESSRWLMRGDTEIPGLFNGCSDSWAPSVVGSMYGGLLAACKVAGPLATCSIFWQLLQIQATHLVQVGNYLYPTALVEAVQICLGRKRAPYHLYSPQPAG